MNILELETPRAAARSDLDPLDPTTLIEAAAAIGERIRAKRLYSKAGSVAWCGLTGYGTATSPLRMSQLGPDLYDGTSGIALFLAALARVTGNGDYRTLALEAIEPLSRKVVELAADPERAAKVNLPVGGLLGLGSFVYGLLRVGTLAGEPRLVRAAHDATTLFTKERIQGDQRVRIQTGSAGAALALLALHRALPEQNRAGKTPLDVAIDCAQHLCESRVAYAGLPPAWPLGPQKPPLADFGYGAAGISYALLRVNEAEPRPELEDAAAGGLTFVRALYAPEHKNWRDLRAAVQARSRPPEGTTWKDVWYNDWSDSTHKPVSTGDDDAPLPVVDAFNDSWCHGGTGIALGKLAALHLVDTGEVRQEIAGALATARSFAHVEVFERARAREDDLCCGHMGRTEVLLHAHRILGDGALLAAARTLARRVWRRAQTQEHYSSSAARGTDTFAPSLFQGEAGIGYTYLRLARPDALPSLLLLE